MKISFYTLGCRVNQYETEMMKERFSKLGHFIVGEGEWADAYVINTCTVTSLADRKSRQFIRRMKRINPESIICVTGCYAQVSPEDVSKVEGVNLIVGTSDKGDIPRLVTEYREQYCCSGFPAKPEIFVRTHEKGESYRETGIITSMDGKTRANIKIQEGCNRFCTYCEIPFARGDVRSRQPMAVLEEAKALIASGFKEVVLTGINTALYGTENNFKPQFPEGYEKYAELWKASCNEEGVCKYGTGLGLILAMLNDLEGDFRIRISSLEPTVINKDDIYTILGYDKLCHHLHLSMQSGSDSVLKSMNRHYTREDYMEIAKALFEFDSHFGISTDIIAGFPGETEEDFQYSIDIVDEIDFCKVHAFDYSKRTGTIAARMENQIHPSIKKERVKRLISAGEKAFNRFIKKSAGEIRTVLVEERDENGMYSGYTDNYIRVYIKSENEGLKGQLVKVVLEKPYCDGVIGVVK